MGGFQITWVKRGVDTGGLWVGKQGVGIWIRGIVSVLVDQEKHSDQSESCRSEEDTPFH
jgi:hypothetical protein